jgi:hypothetical protein
MSNFIKFLFLNCLFYSFLNASTTESGIYFNNYEENATIYLCNYYPYSHFKELRITATTSKNIVNGRKHNLYTSIHDINNISGISATQLSYLKSDSHLIDWSDFSTDWGMTVHQKNFIYGIAGSLIGFVFLFFFIQIIIGAV